MIVVVLVSATATGGFGLLDAWSDDPADKV